MVPVWHPCAVLDREDDAVLAEIEAALRRDDPAFVLLIERLDHDPLGVAGTIRNGETRTAATDADPAEHPGTVPPSGPTDRGSDPTPPHQFNRRYNDPVEAFPQGPGPSRRHPDPVLGTAKALGAPAAHLATGGTLRQWLGLIAALVAALVLTVTVAALAGPDLGGLVGVASMTAATFVGCRRMAPCRHRPRRS